MGGRDFEIPLLLMSLYLSCRVSKVLALDLSRRSRQVGSLAGAAHLLKDNTGVLRLAQSGQKPLVD